MNEMELSQLQSFQTEINIALASGLSNNEITISMLDISPLYSIESGTDHVA